MSKNTAINEINKKEALRWAKAGCPRVWVTNKSLIHWGLNDVPLWDHHNWYIVDDVHAELRKFQIQHPEAEFEFRLNCNNCWEPTTAPVWDISLTYRIKPKFKVGDCIMYNRSVIASVNIITAVCDDKYILDNGCFVLFCDQGNYTIKPNKSLISLPEDAYPVFKVAHEGTDREFIVRFDGRSDTELNLYNGEIVFAVNGCCNLQRNLSDPIDDYWDDVAYNESSGLYDKQPILCWNDGDLIYSIRFYDVIDDCTYNLMGERGGDSFDNMIAYPHPTDEFIIQSYMQLKN